MVVLRCSESSVRQRDGIRYAPTEGRLRVEDRRTRHRQWDDAVELGHRERHLLRRHRHQHHRYVSNSVGLMNIKVSSLFCISQFNQE